MYTFLAPEKPEKPEKYLYTPVVSSFKEPIQHLLNVLRRNTIAVYIIIP